jgi:Uma2 family endonuclease
VSSLTWLAVDHGLVPAPITYAGCVTVSPGQSMSWDDFARLPEDVRYEYIDGKVVVTDFPTGRHALTIARLMASVSAALPDTHVALSPWGGSPARTSSGPI